MTEGRQIDNTSGQPLENTKICLNILKICTIIYNYKALILIFCALQWYDPGCHDYIAQSTSHRHPDERNLITVRDKFGLTYPSEAPTLFAIAVEIIGEVTDQIVKDITSQQSG